MPAASSRHYGARGSRARSGSRSTAPSRSSSTSRPAGRPRRAAFARNENEPQWQPTRPRGAAREKRGRRMRRKHWVVAALALACAAAAVFGAMAATASPKQQKLTKVTLQLKWVTQAQFAGYYAALEKGYYRKAGLDVSIKVGGPSITPEQVVLSGQAQ